MWELFSGVATIVTGGVAIGLYLMQKRDNKTQAAKTLLSEIRIAENRIEEISNKIENGLASDLPTVFTTNNWKKYSPLFINDFDQDELELINRFYDYGMLIEEFAIRNNNFFWITTEERGRITVQKTAEFICESYDKGADNYLVDAKSRIDSFSDGMDQLNSGYSPNKTLNSIRAYIPKVPKITTSTCGAKLKKIAHVKS